MKVTVGSFLNHCGFSKHVCFWRTAYWPRRYIAMKTYNEIRIYSIVEIENAINDDDVDKLIYIAMSVALYSDDQIYAEQILESLSFHHNESVRGNSILGVGHLARRFNKISNINLIEIVNAALNDPSDFVKGQADSAIDDIETFL